MAIQTKTYNQLLGDLVRHILPNTPLNDISVGSALYTLLEAVAASDFDNNASILSVLELLTLDALTNNDLDNRARDYGLSRFTAQRASGSVTISDSSIQKRSTGLYAVKPAPIAGSTVIYVNDASQWMPTGYLYLGRGTQSFEGPIPYTSITNNGSFYTIQLGSVLKKDHLLSDVVVDQQGKLDRLIVAGTAVTIPANNQMPEIKYTTLRDAVIPAGEDNVTGVPIIAERAGSQGNASIGSIVAFNTIPFTGAAVVNTSALTDGRDIESDAELRERVKSYSSTLARGTKDAILASIIGVADAEESKQVVSAVISEPPTLGEPSIIYLDDGRGFQPSTKGQSVDVLLASANGNEEFLQLANYPLPRPQAVNTADGPYELVNGMTLFVYVDGIEESVQFTTANFNNISSATLPEIVIAINDQVTLFKCRLANNSTRLLLYPTSFSAETIQVVSLRASDNKDLFANSILKFPTNTFSYISLYRNNELLRERETEALLVTKALASWSITIPGNIVVAVDGTPPQNQSFSISDFGGRPINTGTLEEWVAAFNNKFAGLTASATSSGAIQLISNKTGKASSLEILSGTYFTAMFGNIPTVSLGQESDFDLNRQTGNLRIKTGITAGDAISAGTADAKSNVVSSSTMTGSFGVASDANGRPSNAILSVDDVGAKALALQLSVGAIIQFSIPGSGLLRVTSSTANAFAKVQPGDFIYIPTRNSALWASDGNTGLFKVIAVGGHTTAGVDTYVDLGCITAVAETKVLLALEDILAFRTSTYPQIWKGASTTTPAAASIAEIIESIASTLVNVKSSIYKTSSIKSSSTSESDGSLAALGASGTAGIIFPQTNASASNQSHIAHKTTAKDMISYPKRSDLWTNNLGSMTTPELFGGLTEDAGFATNLSEPYGELLQCTGLFVPSVTKPNDIISMTSGSNAGLLRSIKDVQAGSYVGTQHALPKTQMPFVTGDSLTIFKSLSLTPDDNIVFIVDQDSVNKTVVVPMSRTGRIHSMYPFTNTSFSAYDADNEPGVTFDSVPVWGTDINKTDFRDYAVWFKARNWYSSGGAGSGKAAMILRATEFGPHGENISFRMEYPSSPNQATVTHHSNRPDRTIAECILGSGAARATGISSGLQFDVIDLGSGMFRYQFTGSIDLSPVVIGDIIGITNTSGVSMSNAGSYQVMAKGTDYIDIYNPNGAATGLGVQEVTQVTCGSDVVGTPTTHTIDTVSAAALDGKYFTLTDDIGTVAYWYDVDNNGTAAPTVSGAYRYVKIATVITADTAATVATKTSQYLDLDVKFSSTVSISTITVVNTFNGDVTVGGAGTSGFTIAKTVIGTSDNSIDGEYFKIYDEDGSVAVWYNVSGIAPEPFHGCNRAISVTSVVYGDAATVVASKTAAVLSLWSPSLLGSVITLTDPVVGGRAAPSAGTLGSNGFSATTSTNGSNAIPETILVPSSISIYPLATNTVQDVIDSINQNSMIEAVANSTPSLLFTNATRDELYVPSTGYTTSLAYGHNPDPISGANSFIQLFDSQSWVKSFQNAGPNFTLKTNFVLNGAAPLAYNPATVANKDSSEIGEMFKLIPVTLTNIKHHFSQKALSQLPIVSDIDISNAYKSIQLKSKKLGSSGAVEVVGGRANSAEFSIFGEAQDIVLSGRTYTEIKTAAYPATLNVGDYVELYNANETQRKATLLASDKVSVTTTSTTADYVYQTKDIGITGASLTISDVSASYGKNAGIIWRWTFSAAMLSNVKAGDLLIARGVASLSQRNQTLLPSSGITGFPIVAMDSFNKTLDVLNPRGVSMPTTLIGSGLLQVVPTPVVRKHIQHKASITILSISSAAGVAGVFTASQHGFVTGDMVEITDNTLAGTYSITRIDDVSFSFVSATPGVFLGGFCRIDGEVDTRYAIESLNNNNFFRLRHVSGESPSFMQCGASCDDVVVIQGLTFNSSNNGRFRIYSVLDDSIVFQNVNGMSEQNTIRSINNLDTSVTWTANVPSVVGVVGSFKNVVVGSWIKKYEDSKELYTQVIGMNDVPDLATTVTLGSNYAGTTSVSPGVVYHMTNDVGSGIYLKNVDDIMILSGDSAAVGDELFIDDIVDADWFSIQNTGRFVIQSISLNASFLPALTVNTAAGLAETDVLVSVAPSAIYIIEGADNTTVLVKEVKHIAIDEFNSDRRTAYLYPANYSYKLSQSNGTAIRSTGKLGYSSEVTTGIDGYLYYTGLMRKVQRIIDGFEPDAANYPGRRAVGSTIEPLPPLIRRVRVAIEVTTNEGVNLNEISNDIVSTIINYVTNLGVGSDVILSEIVVQVMSIRGVAAVTFTNPTPSQERIAIGDVEKAFIEGSDISIA